MQIVNTSNINTPPATISFGGQFKQQMQGVPTTSDTNLFNPTNSTPQTQDSNQIMQNIVNRQQPTFKTTPTTDLIKQLSIDVQNGAQIQQINNSYPELKGNINLIKQLQFDINKGATIQQINQAYPELTPTQGFISGALDKIGSNFTSGIDRIQQAGEGIASGKYNIPEGLVRGAAGALNTAFSPISGVIGEVAQKGLDNIPKDFKDYIGQKTTPTINDVKKWYNNQSPQQRRNLDNIGVGLEVLTSFIGGKAAQPLIKPTIKAGKVIKNINNTRVIKKAVKQTNKGTDILYQAVNPTTKETKAVLKQRVHDLLPYIDKNPLKNSLSKVKARIDITTEKALTNMNTYENNVGIKGTLHTDNIVKHLKETYLTKLNDSYIKDSIDVNIAKKLITKLEGFGTTVKGPDIIKIRRAWDTIINKNKGFAQSADATSKGDIYATANKFFRDEIKKSNSKYATYLKDYHTSRSIGDVIQATLDKGVGKPSGGALDNISRAGAFGLGNIPGFILNEARIQGTKFIKSPSYKLTRGKKLINKGTNTLNKKGAKHLISKKK